MRPTVFCVLLLFPLTNMVFCYGHHMSGEYILKLIAYSILYNWTRLEGIGARIHCILTWIFGKDSREKAQGNFIIYDGILLLYPFQNAKWNFSSQIYTPSATAATLTKTLIVLWESYLVWHIVYVTPFLKSYFKHWISSVIKSKTGQILCKKIY